MNRLRRNGQGAHRHASLSNAVHSETVISSQSGPDAGTARRDAASASRVMTIKVIRHCTKPSEPTKAAGGPGDARA